MSTTWKNIEIKAYPVLQEHLTADVIVVGGGITGILSAYFLAREGKKVVVLEKECLKESMTAYTTAFITYVIDTPLHELIQIFGQRKARLVWQSGDEAINAFESLIDDEDISCEFVRTDEYIVAKDEKEYAVLKEEARLASLLGFPVRSSRGDALPFKNAGYAWIPRQAKFHPLAFLSALRQKAEGEGALFFEQSEVTELRGGATVVATTSEGSVSAPHVCIATYDPFNHPQELFAHKGPYTSYILELEVPAGSLREGLYLDMANPYNFFRVDPKPGALRVVVGGADHRKEIPIDPQKCWGAVEDFWRKTLPHIPFKRVKEWKGCILEPVDGLPYIGTFSRLYPNQFVAMGFSGNGMTYAMIAALLFRDRVMKRENPYEEVYDPGRKESLKALFEKGKDYAEEFFGGALKNIFRRKI